MCADLDRKGKDNERDNGTAVDNKVTKLQLTFKLFFYKKRKIKRQSSVDSYFIFCKTFHILLYQDFINCTCEELQILGIFLFNAILEHGPVSTIQARYTSLFQIYDRALDQQCWSLSHVNIQNNTHFISHYSAHCKHFKLRHAWFAGADMRTIYTTRTTILHAWM